MVDPVSLSVRPVGDFDEQRAAAAVRELLLAIGEDPDREGLLDTPQRVTRSDRELLSSGIDPGHASLFVSADDVVAPHVHRST